jgi:hypothetical protein
MKFRPGLLLVAGLCAAVVAGCGRGDDAKAPPPADSNAVALQGSPIRSLPTNATSGTNVSAPSLSPAAMAALLERPDATEDGFIKPGFDKLSAFKYDVYEVYSETNSGRAPLRSDDVIPPEIKSYDGKRVMVSGYVLPLRTRRGVVTEFLLLRDQGTCCFGARAQINHFMRVSFPAGIKPADPVSWTVRGKLQVGEVYVQGYLTGIYNLDAESAVESRPTAGPEL